MRVEACLNGDRRPGSHPALPSSPDQLAADTRAAVAAGASGVHIHPRDGRGRESLEPQVIAPVLERIRTAVPGVPISVTTALSAEPDPWRRYDLVQRWGTMPDAVTVNLHEPGSVEVARLLIDRRIEVEAGVWTVEAARILLASGLAAGFSRILLEPTQRDVDDAVANASRIEELLDRSGSALPRLLHGSDDTAWPLLDAAVGRGHDIRIGLEDTLKTPEGGEAADNAGLVAIAVRRLRAAA